MNEGAGEVHLLAVIALMSPMLGVAILDYHSTRLMRFGA
jgi:hypothetical protein